MVKTGKPFHWKVQNSVYILSLSPNACLSFTADATTYRLGQKNIFLSGKSEQQYGFE
jgi:hypothetical protein